MELTIKSYKLLSYDKKDDIKMDIINHYRKHQFLYDCRNSDYINRDLWEHTQRQFDDGYADRQHTSNRYNIGKKIFHQSELIWREQFC